MKLTSEQFAQLQSALTGSFNREELRRMVYVGLGQILEHIASGETDPEIVFTLLQWAQRTDNITELMQAAANANPTSKALKQAARDCATWYASEVTAKLAAYNTTKNVAPAPAGSPMFPGAAQPSEAKQTSPGFFISYNKADRGWAEWIAWQLEAEGYTTVNQAWDFRPGSNFIVEMQKAAAEAQRTIAVLSPDYLAARFTAPEWAAAFAQDPTGEQGKLLPVRVRTCELKGLLPQVVYIDLVGLDEESALATLLAGVKHSRAKPVAAPTFPGAPATVQRPVGERPQFPGLLPSVWNVPQRRNPNFVGRDAQLEQLYSAFGSGKPGCTVQVLTGLGGVGKTQTAVEYAYRYAAEYDLVWWVRAEEPAALTGDFAQLAASLQMSEAAEPDQLRVVQAVLRWLGSHNRWLLVLDNAMEPADVRAYLPAGDTGHVLITTRNPVGWGRLGAAQEVPGLALLDAVAFMLRRSREEDADGAAKLAEELGYLPLALEQAGAYMEQSGKSAVEYLRLYRTRGRDLLSRGRPEGDYPDTVLSTWNLAFNAVSSVAGAGEMLNLCAYLAPNDISLELIKNGTKELPSKLSVVVADELACDDAIAALRSYSLVRVNDGSLHVHRLVQGVTRDRLSLAEQKDWTGAAVRLVNEAFPTDSDDVRTWAQCDGLLPHALATAGYGEALSIEPEATGRLLNQVGLYLWGRARYTEARTVYERALAIDEVIFGPEHPNVATDINNLGLVLADMGDLPGAKQAFERALAIGKVALTPEHPWVINYSGSLGSVLHRLGDLRKAQQTYEQALAIAKVALGLEHPSVATLSNGLGLVLLDVGNLFGAKQAFKRALAIGEVAFGPDHPAVATFSNDLGLALLRLGDLRGAKQAIERALAIDEVALGPEHPNVARDVNNLGGVLQHLGDLHGAKQAFERALSIGEVALGREHYNMTTYRDNLRSVQPPKGRVRH